MNWIDLLVLVVWGLAALWGFKTGIIRMIVPLVVVLVGLAFASRIAEPVGNLFSFISENENIQTVAAFIAIFLALFILGGVLGNVVKSAISVIPLAGLANSLVGAFIGILIGFVLLSGILTGLQKFPVGGISEKIDGSALGTFLADNFDVVTRGIKLIPGDWNQRARGLTSGILGPIDTLKDGIPISTNSVPVEVIVDPK
ncbi:MAG TPA: CvpA family protein [Dehalococcoidia bacterium]|nr:CvpA family protein [Dehalococcoidia bacterium]